MTMDLQTIVPFLSGDLLAKIFELLGVSSSGFPKVSMSKLRNSIIYQCFNQGAGPHLARGRGGHLGRAGPELGTRHQPGPGHWRLAGHVPPLHVSPRVLAPSTDTDNVSAAGGTVNK